MRRYQKLVRRKWRFRLAIGLPIVILVILASAVLSSGAVFTSKSANPSNIFTTGQRWPGSPGQLHPVLG